MKLHEPTPSDWAEKVLRDFDTFLIDHSTCERKAAATAMHFVVQYPDRTELIDPMIALAREEMMHFHQVSKLMLKRGLKFAGDDQNPYVNALIKNCRTGRNERLLDRLLTFGVVEARGQERFALVAKALVDPSLKSFYQRLADAEERHHEIYIELALKYFSKEEVFGRLEEILKTESQIVKGLAFRVAVH